MKSQDYYFSHRICIRNYFIQFFSDASVPQGNGCPLVNGWSYSCPSIVSCVFYIVSKLIWGKPEVMFQFLFVNLTPRLSRMDPAVHLFMLFSTGSYYLQFPFCLLLAVWTLIIFFFHQWKSGSSSLVSVKSSWVKPAQKKMELPEEALRSLRFSLLSELMRMVSKQNHYQFP